MSTNNTPWLQLSGPNLGYASEMYERYQKDSESVDVEWRRLFAQWGAPEPNTKAVLKNETTSSVESDCSDEMILKAVAVEKLAQNIRSYGHLAAKIDPLVDEVPSLDDFNLTFNSPGDEELKKFPVELVWPHDPAGMSNAFEVISKLKSIYTGSLAFQFSHVHDEEERDWLYCMVETGKAYLELSNENRVSLLKSLVQVEDFEQFIHRTFQGQKRFSIEGLDMLIPIVDEAIREGVRANAKHVIIGMAHRGRLNMLAHVLDKPYEAIFAEFQHAPNKDLVPSEGSMGINYGWTGDVKYHLGADNDVDNGPVHAHLTLANNPSHLEFVNPVVEGYTRAAQEDRDRSGPPSQDTDRAFAILIHGDAAFPGEGVVAETLNLSRLQGYHTGGTIHIIANNQIGFTTESGDDRSTKYASDLAKGFEIPVVHVNSDDPEACLAAVHLAHEYRKRFKKDFLIDLVGYRRYGHNEMDDPEATQPLLYQKVNNHPSVRKQYAENLKHTGVITDDIEDKINNKIKESLEIAFNKMKNSENPEVKTSLSQKFLKDELVSLDTTVSKERLSETNIELVQWPKSFHIYPKLEKILHKRINIFDEKGLIDWALAETLAFATIIQDGVPVRITGQDTERGTFAHRHFVLHDAQNGNKFIPLQNLTQGTASFAIHNSPLSEAAVLGFEYGYNVFADETLVIWEAQFGDFVNSAQVIIDQFLLTGQAKWRQKSDLVLLLPHGYEGQGPEHSSARLERFLQLAADDNFIVANLTSSAQYFHLLRRQAARVGTKAARPLIIMTPKSLLRNPRTASNVESFSKGGFQPVLESRLENEADGIQRLILCSGKIAVDIQEEVEANREDFEKVHVIRIEQLYPFPQKELAEKWQSFKHVKEIVWVQEEPKNMGAWSYIEPRIRKMLPQHISLDYIGRPERTSPAEGIPDIHKSKQQSIIQTALTLKS